MPTLPIERGGSLWAAHSHCNVGPKVSPRPSSRRRLPAPFPLLPLCILPPPSPVVGAVIAIVHYPSFCATCATKQPDSLSSPACVASAFAQGRSLGTYRTGPPAPPEQADAQVTRASGTAKLCSDVTAIQFSALSNLEKPPSSGWQLKYARTHDTAQAGRPGRRLRPDRQLETLFEHVPLASGAESAVAAAPLPARSPFSALSTLALGQHF